jgi:uncharacterized damage-inducible protein DinB
MVTIEAAREPPISALIRVLDDLALVVMRLDAETFTSRPRPDISGSIGGHVRHVLDHVTAFVEAGSRGQLNYDQRQRGTDVEADPVAALSRICALHGGLERIATRDLDDPIRVVAQFAADGSTLATWSTIGRELAFVMSHTIHHQAIIALLLDDDGLPALPARFGYAPSTPAES